MPEKTQPPLPEKDSPKKTRRRRPSKKPEDTTFAAQIVADPKNIEDVATVGAVPEDPYIEARELGLSFVPTNDVEDEEETGAVSTTKEAPPVRESAPVKENELDEPPMIPDEIQNGSASRTVRSRYASRRPQRRRVTTTLGGSGRPVKTQVRRVDPTQKVQEEDPAVEKEVSVQVEQDPPVPIKDQPPIRVRKRVELPPEDDEGMPRYAPEIPVGGRQERYPEEDGEDREKIEAIGDDIVVQGPLDIMADGYGFLRTENYSQSINDIYLAPAFIKRYRLRQGDYITGLVRPQEDADRYKALHSLTHINGIEPDKVGRRPQFDRLTPIHPNERYKLETRRNELSTRIIDLVSPIGKGQRGMIVSPPKAGKTTILQKIANAISINDPDAHLIVLLVDERPEEVTDMQRSIDGEVVYSTFDKTPENHVRIAELVLERAMRLVEIGKDVVILLDSITRLARAYNITINPTGRTLSGGLDPGALYGPKRFFGAARNIELGGSLTVVATALVDTGSRMDEVIFEEFKGTGNMEVYLDRKLSEKRIFPAIDINRSSTRREELLLSVQELDAVWAIRRAFGQVDTGAVTEMIINLLLKTTSNTQFVSSVNISLNDKNLLDAVRRSRQQESGEGRRVVATPANLIQGTPGTQRIQSARDDDIEW